MAQLQKTKMQKQLRKSEAAKRPKAPAVTGAGGTASRSRYGTRVQRPVSPIW